MVGTVKPVIKKCLDENQDIDKALLHMRATPASTNIPSPGEMLFGRLLQHYPRDKKLPTQQMNTDII